MFYNILSLKDIKVYLFMGTISIPYGYFNYTQFLKNIIFHIG